jgi:mannose-6-phosphate isomerase-like protein (cupin superfamily)
MDGNQKFRIFRAEGAPVLEKTEFQSMAPLTPAEIAGFAKMAEAGADAAHDVRVLVNIPGFSLVHLWFKKDFPLPLHSHNVDCMYFVIAGSLKLGTETLGPRDSFFVPAEAPYTYRPGPEGVEVLEIRLADHWDFKNHAKSQAFYDRAVETIAANLEAWRQAKRPALNS